MTQPQYTRSEWESCYNRTVDTVYRVCRMFFHGNTADAEDAVQATYLKLLDYPYRFENEEHEKAWLIVTASNICRNTLRHWWRKTVNIDSVPEAASPEGHTEELSELVRSLPEKCRTAVYLYYYEGYSGQEIARLLHKKESTVFGYLHSGRELLKEKWKEGDHVSE